MGSFIHIGINLSIYSKKFWRSFNAFNFNSLSLGKNSEIFVSIDKNQQIVSDLRATSLGGTIALLTLYIYPPYILLTVFSRLVSRITLCCIGRSYLHTVRALNTIFFHRNLAVWHKHAGDVIYYVAIIPSLGIAMLLFVLTAGVLMKWVIFTTLISFFFARGFQKLFLWS